MTEEVSREHPDKSISVEFMPLDLASLQSVKRFTEDYKQKGLPLHLLINNAGIANVHEGRVLHTKPCRHEFDTQLNVYT